MKNLIISFAFIVFIFGGCKHCSEFGNDDLRQVSISFSSKSLSSSLLKSSGLTDNSIIKVILYGVDNFGKVEKTFIPPLPESSETSLQLVISRKIKSLYAIANPYEGMESAEPETVSELMDMIADFSDAPELPFLMSGKGDIDGVNINIELFRSVAKVEIFSKNEDFKIESVTVKNTPKKGYVFKKEHPSTPTPDDRGLYPASSIPTLYVAESTALNPTRFVVTGKIEGRQASYELVLKNKEANIDIERNMHYRVGVAPLNETNCSISVDIPEWIDMQTTVQVIPKPPPPDPYKNGIKILAIGNSYSQDAMRYLYDMLRQIKEPQYNTTLVNAYIESGTLNDHANCIKNNTSITQQVFNTSGGATSVSGKSLKQIIEQDAWDIITLQQSSWFSGKESSYNADLDTLIIRVKKHATNKNFKLGWHMTWAWHVGHYGFPGTYTNQAAMYSGTCDAVKAQILNHPTRKFDFIIPTGTAIQNARGIPALGDSNLNRDIDCHLNDLGRYIAGAMWIKTILGDISGLSKSYNTTNPAITTTNFPYIEQAVNAAHAKPFP